MIAHFASVVGGNRHVLCIPWAWPDPADERLATWAESTLTAHGIHSLTIASSVDEWDELEVAAFDAFFIGSGNTYLLLSRLGDTGLAAELVDAANSGVPIYGGSAGAVALGARIGSCAHADQNDVGLAKLQGLDLCDGFVIWPHYLPDQDKLIAKFIDEHAFEVISLPEDSGVCFGGHGPLAFGAGDVWRWAHEERNLLTRNTAV